MAPESEQYRLLDLSPDLQNPSSESASTSPLSAATTRHRAGYAKLASVSSIEQINLRPIESDPTAAPPPVIVSESQLGLGIMDAPTRRTRDHRRRQLSSHSSLGPSSQRPEDAETQHHTPQSCQTDSFGSTASTVFEAGFDEFDDHASTAKVHTAERFYRVTSPADAQSVYATSHTAYADDNSQDKGLRSGNTGARGIRRRIGGYVSVIILTLAVFSTIFSGAFLVVALTGPKWGHRISNVEGSLSPSTAATLTSFFAKLIEISFVTVVVAFNGQVLARRASKLEYAKGVTLADISMRTWIMQPGTILTQWETVKYAGLTILGVSSLIASLLATLYTSAATTLVQPQLKYSSWASTSMQGLVKTQFANPTYVGKTCLTPIPASFDRIYGEETCIQLEHVAMAFHNYETYLGEWTNLVRAGGGSSDLAQRPKGFALLNDNTTIAAPWIDQQPVKTFNNTHPRYINNITMAMPHVGVIQAAIDPINNLLQPGQLDGAAYGVKASVPSPFVNVLCATVLEEDLTPFVYELRPGGRPHSELAWRAQLDPFLGGTSLDHIFGFGPQYGPGRYPPIFSKLPIDYNTIVNDTNGMPWGRSTLFLLAKGGPRDLAGNDISQYYSLCQMQAGLSPSCSTNYNASRSGGSLEATCDESTNELAYEKSQPNAMRGNATISKDWVNIGGTSLRSLSLNDGTFNGNSSNARLLSQFMVTTPSLDSALPSMAEALSVLCACTLIQSITDAPFNELWPFANSTLTPGVYQSFNASVHTLQYASGGVNAAENAFFVVLFGVFLVDVAVLVYFLAHRYWYIDFGDPISLLGLAVNSPPSLHLQADNGRGSGITPYGEHYRVHWKLRHDQGHYFMESSDPPDTTTSSPSDSMQGRARSLRRWIPSITSFEGLKSPVLPGGRTAKG